MDDPQIIRAAYVLARDPAFAEVLKTLKADAVEEFMGSAPSDEERRTQAYWRNFAITQMEQQIKSWAAKFQR